MAGLRAQSCRVPGRSGYRVVRGDSPSISGAFCILGVQGELITLGVRSQNLPHLLEIERELRYWTSGRSLQKERLRRRKKNRERGGYGVLETEAIKFVDSCVVVGVSACNFGHFCSFYL